MLSRSEIQNEWENIVDIAFNDYKKLNKHQRIWFNIESLTTGGIIDHYINIGAEYNKETIEDLEVLGFANISKDMREINKLFKHGYPPKDITLRSIEVEQWDQKHDSLLDEIDSKFWKISDLIDNKLIEYINYVGIHKFKKVKM